DEEKKRELSFVAAYAPYAQSGFPASAVIDDDAASGWAVSGRVGDSHLLTLIPEQPIEVDEASVLQLELEHRSSHRHHLLGSFRIEASTSDAVAEWAMLDSAHMAIHRQPEEQRTKQAQAQLLAFYSSQVAEETRALRKERTELSQRLKALAPQTSVPIMRQLEASARRDSFVQIRGNYKSLGTKVSPGVPAVFHTLDESTIGPQGIDRLALAHWLVDRRNPLTARVWVNRWWESLFGLGLVRSSEEFGTQGDRPTHPQLLDWLACELMDNGWDGKRLLRLLVTSHTYRQTSRVTEAELERDEENIWLARGPRVRLSAESVRDQALSVAGLLSRKMYGPPVRPPQPQLGLTAAFGSATDWQTSEGEDRYRRGVYTTWRRSNPYPSLATFDAPSREVCTLRRDSTNTPLQALVTLNDPAFVEAAQGLARRIVLHSPLADDNDPPRLQQAFLWCTARRASEAELQALGELLSSARAHFAQDKAAARQLASDPLGPLDDGADVVELAAWTAVGNVLLNLDEVLMKR
ncbi:MAG: DUF1553 domain-containing protein, partial [Planctomycetales bacterium]|nr:DUF1553 domain-containing protein [Planctomycetales bacterium]